MLPPGAHPGFADGPGSHGGPGQWGGPAGPGGSGGGGYGCRGLQARKQALTDMEVGRLIISRHTQRMQIHSQQSHGQHDLVYGNVR